MRAGGAEKTTETHSAAGKLRYNPFGALPSPHQSVRLRESCWVNIFCREPYRGVVHHTEEKSRMRGLYTR